MTSPITTHVLDTSLGKPAAGVAVVLEVAESGGWKAIGRAETDAHGRVMQGLVDPASFAKGRYRLTFDTEAYFAAQNAASFYPQVTVVFIVRDEAQHFHVPLLLSPYGYSTYRGS